MDIFAENAPAIRTEPWPGADYVIYELPQPVSDNPRYGKSYSG